MRVGLVRAALLLPERRRRRHLLRHVLERRDQGARGSLLDQEPHWRRWHEQQRRPREVQGRDVPTIGLRADRAGVLWALLHQVQEGVSGRRGLSGRSSPQGRGGGCTISYITRGALSQP